MKQIWKFPINHPSVIHIEIPTDSQILTIQMQNDTPCIWALVNSNNPIEQRELRLYATGENIDQSESLKYINSFQMHNNSLVFHLFEVLK